MKGAEIKHVLVFKQTKKRPSEEILATLEGWIGDMMGSGKNAQHNGSLIITTERAVFYRKGLIGEVFETIPLPRITSIETLSRMGYRVLRMHTSHDDLSFKTFEPAEWFDKAYEAIEAHRHDLAATAQIESPSLEREDLAVRLSRLEQLRKAELISEAEYADQRSRILSSL